MGMIDLQMTGAVARVIFSAPERHNVDPFR
jgi:hypothetical protein